jgi:hypothetical protein
MAAPPPISDRRRLSTGLSRRRRAVNAALTVLSLPLLLLAVLLATVSAAEGEAAFAVPLFATAAGLSGVLAASWTSAYRRTYWIEGTCLIRHGLGTDQRCDLAVAAVETQFPAPRLGPSIPKLIATEPGSRPMTLRLRMPERPNRMLPPSELTLLADAISARPRMEPGTEAVVEGLRAMARNPLGSNG